MSKLKSYFIKTYGCQMNEADSERITGWYEGKSWKPAKNIYDADEVVINTCSVRESAENRVFGLVNNLAKLKIKNCKLKIVLTGCMLYHGISWLKKKLPQVDEFKPIKEFKISPSSTVHHPLSAWVPIMEGCDHFCSYCVVPYARGRGKSKPFAEILCGVKEQARRGGKEITLLGQNVNSYGKDFNNQESVSMIQFIDTKYPKIKRNNKSPFALLLEILCQIEGLEKIKFLTSNPWDLTDDIIEAMKLPEIDCYLHLPVQSGNDEILKRMDRKYTAKDYLNLVKKIRAKIPDIKIGTDIIVGFPGETEEQFQNTVNLCQKVGFEKAYIARYSPRPGTVAYKLKDDVPPEEKKRRWRILEELINK